MSSSREHILIISKHLRRRQRPLVSRKGEEKLPDLPPRGIWHLIQHVAKLFLKLLHGRDGSVVKRRRRVHIRWVRTAYLGC